MLNRLAVTVIVVIAFTIIAVAVNAYPWYLGLNRSIKWNNGIALTDDNVLLDVKYADPGNSKLTVILVHDYGQDKTFWSKLDLDERLLNYDNAVVSFDLRFHGNSTPVLASGGGTYVVSSEDDYVDDIKTMVKWAEKNIGKPIVIISYGEVSKAVLQGISELDDKNIRGVVLIAVDYKDVATLINKTNVNIMVLSNDPNWSNVPVYFVGIGVSRDGMVKWSNDQLDLLFNWIKNTAFNASNLKASE